jgi:hypothetical protein
MRRMVTLFVSAAAVGLVAALGSACPGFAASAHTAVAAQSSHASVMLSWPVTITLRTVPPLPGVRFQFDGRTVVTNAKGVVTVTEPHNFGLHTLTLVQTHLVTTDRQYYFARWAGQRDPNQAFVDTVRGLPMRADYTVTAGFTVSCPVSPRLVEQTGSALSPAQVSELTVLSDRGQPTTLRTSGVSWLLCAAPAYRDSQLLLRNLQYSVQTMLVSGANVVHAGLQRFSPITTPDPKITGYFYSLRMTAHDALFGGGVGSYALLTMPNHKVRKVVFGPSHVATLRNLPLGTYQVTVKAGGASIAGQDVRLSRDQTADLPVVSSYDVAVLVIGLLLVVVGLPLLSGSQRRRVVSLARRGAQVLHRAMG